MSAPQNIIIKNARVHNLKNLSVEFARNKLTVVTGVSGSGKSSLVFDTLFAEGQRRYVESLSAYARQFLGRMQKPDVDYIKGISPAIAIEQKVNIRNPRSTVATSTEIYDYLKLLFARAGKTFSPESKLEVKMHTVESVAAFIMHLQAKSKVLLLVEIKPQGRTLAQELEVLMQKGFSRLWIPNEFGGEVVDIADFSGDARHSELEASANENGKGKSKKPAIKSAKVLKVHVDKAQGARKQPDAHPPPLPLYLLVDRFITDPADEEQRSRLRDSIQTAFNEGSGECWVNIIGGISKMLHFTNRFEADGQRFEVPSLHFFSFNNPYGACKTCEGYGSVIGIDENLVVPNKNLSIYEEAIAPWRGQQMDNYRKQFISTCRKNDFPIHRSYNELSQEEIDFLWLGGKDWFGLNGFIKELEAQTYKIQYRVLLSRYRGKKLCPDCFGTRLRKDTAYVLLTDRKYTTDKKETDFDPFKRYKSLQHILLMSVTDSLSFFQQLEQGENEHKISKRILAEIVGRLQCLLDVGLGYLSLNRLSNSLSGGESQRINLATSLGSSLVGSLYILDEPSIGLHSRDTQRLIKVLKNLRDLGNTVIVVEHDEEIMEISDELMDIGPLAGTQGGNLVWQGKFADIHKKNESLTAKYLAGEESIEVPKHRRKWNEYIEVKSASENNLKNITVKFPLNCITCITGVSGSGKTSLVKTVLYPSLQRATGEFTPSKMGSHSGLSGYTKSVSLVEMIDQNPIGKSSRSNPVTYIKAYDGIRDLFANQATSKARGYKPSHFSFNVEGGRCETCQGEGETTVEMQFMADIRLPCEDCSGSRFKQEVMEVTYNGLHIGQVLTLTVDEAMKFFVDEKTISYKLRPLQDVGLGYVTLGQSASTLSGGEAQRVKLASFLGKSGNGDQILFIFDEPTTGLHFHDIKKLMLSFEALVKQGHSILIIEHNLEVIKCADWVIDLGPEAGEAGGNVVFEGIPEDLVKCKASYTGHYLKRKL